MRDAPGTSARYPADTYCRWFCTGWLVMWRLLRIVGIDLDEATR